MATIDKLEYINDTKTLIKNALNINFNSQIGDNDTFRSYAQKIDDIYENWPKVSEENTNFTLNSTKEGKMKIELKGNTSQATNIITYTCLGTESGDYYFVYNSINYQFTMPTVSANDVLTFDTDTLKLYLDTTEITTTTASTGTLITMNTTPNPNYPQNIHIVSGDNTIEIQGKNLLHLPNGTITNRGITGTISNDNILTYSGTASSSYADITSATRGITLQAGTYMFSIDQPQLCRIVLYVSGEVSFNTIITVGKTSASFTLNEPKIINYRIGITGMTSKNSYSGTIKMQLEKNNKATTYEAYQSQNCPINLGNMELCKITTECQDKIFHNIPNNPYYRSDLIENNWYISKEIGKFIPTGNETWTYDSTYNYCRMGGGTFEDNAVQNNNQMNTHFQYLINSWNAFRNAKTTNGTFMLSSVASSNYQLCIRNVNLTKQSEYVTWIKENNPIFYYQLETPKTILITDNTLIEQLDNLEKAISYDEQTNITQINNDLPFILNVSALKKNSSN